MDYVLYSAERLRFFFLPVLCLHFVIIGKHFFVLQANKDKKYLIFFDTVENNINLQIYNTRIKIT